MCGINRMARQKKKGAIYDESFFVDAYQKKDVENPAFCYKSGLTVYEEGFDANMLTSLGWNGAGFTLNILDGVPTYLTQSEFRYSEVFRVDVNGASMTYSWKLCWRRRTYRLGPYGTFHTHLGV